MIKLLSWFLAVALLLAMLARGWTDGEEPPHCDPWVPLLSLTLNCDTVPILTNAELSQPRFLRLGSSAELDMPFVLMGIGKALM
jgi:hypothetical protein